MHIIWIVAQGWKSPARVCFHIQFDASHWLYTFLALPLVHNTVYIILPLLYSNIHARATQLSHPLNPSDAHVLLGDDEANHFGFYHHHLAVIIRHIQPKAAKRESNWVLRARGRRQFYDNEKGVYKDECHNARVCGLPGDIATLKWSEWSFCPSKTTQWR